MGKDFPGVIVSEPTQTCMECGRSVTVVPDGLSEKVSDVFPEPPPWSVVLDRQGMAWQNIGEGWLATMEKDHLLWDGLVKTFGPVEILQYGRGKP